MKTICALVVSVILCNSAFAGNISYNAIDLGQPVDGWTTTVTSMNDSGVIVGYCMAPGNTATKGFVWANGSYTFLDSLGGVYTRAYGVNDSGQVVGQYRRADNMFRAFIWQNGTMQDLNIGDSSVGNIAYSINDNGVVAGAYGSRWGFVLKNGATSLLPTLSGDIGVLPYAINNHDVAAGKSFGTGTPHLSAVDWTSGSVASLGLGGNQSWASAINDNGLIIGQCDTGGFLWDAGSLSYYDGYLYAINNNGEIVGVNYTASLVKNGQLFNLNDLIAPGSLSTLSAAYAINDNGDIAGVQANGNIFMLTPVPEPSTMILLFSGLSALLLRRKK
jgi:probable HAF family extracellular repeat protein